MSPEIYWGMRHLSFDRRDSHYLITGSTGSGKTTVLRLLMQSILPWIGHSRNPQMRALIYDAKGDMTSVVHGMIGAKGKPCEVFLLNPFDSRSVAWDIAADVTAPSHAQAVASILVPEEPNATQRFFPDAARSLLSTVMTAFAISAKKRGDQNWTLRDVILALRRKKNIEAVVEIDSATKDKAFPYLEDEKTLPGILSTIATKLDPLEVVASRWQTCADKLSLKEWLDPDSPRSQSIVILGTAPAYRSSIEPVNRILFRRLSDLLLHKQDMPRQPTAPSGGGRSTVGESTWLFLDEVREAGKLDGLPSLLNRGRSKGVTMVLGFQEIEGLQHVYGDKVASEICGQCAYKTFLKTNSHKTAQWIQAHFGEDEQWETDSSTSISRQGATIGTGKKRNTRHHIMTSQVMTMPKLTRENGLTALNDLDASGAEFRRVTSENLEVILAKESTKREHANDVRNDGISELLSVWDKDDFTRLELNLKVEKPSANKKTSEVEKTPDLKDRARRNPPK